jgi:hypothetical protein
VSTARTHRAPGAPGGAGAPSAMGAPPPRRLPPGEGEEAIRRVLEDLVIARQRDPDGKAGVSIDDLHKDLGVSRQHVQRILSAEHPNVNLRAGQILSLRPRVRGLVLAALAAQAEALDGGSIAEDQALHRRVGMLFGRVSEILDRALADGRIDPEEQAELRAGWAQLSVEAAKGAGER